MPIATSAFVADDSAVLRREDRPEALMHAAICSHYRVRLLGAVTAMWTLGACGSVAKYTCPMHPEVVSDVAGKCAKCGMTLVLAAPVGQTARVFGGGGWSLRRPL